QSSKSYNDGQWHHVVGELSGAGLTMYVDGAPVGQNGGTTVAQAYSGYWRIGGDNLGSWPSKPSSNFFKGTIGNVAIYPAALTLAQVQKHYTDAGYTPATPPAPTDAYGAAAYGLTPTTYWRLDEKGSGSTAADTSAYGDNGLYSGGVTKGVASPVSGSTGTAVTLNGSTGLISSTQTFTNPTVYSETMWFKTTTTSGGKLIGFGSSQTGLSSSYDRHVYMLNTGQLSFGTYTGQMNTVVSPQSYNDGKWHFLVATQGPAGMVLYVDGQSVGTNPQTQAQSYTGYWRVGGDNTWGGATSNYFAGTVDEVAIYGSQLSAGQVSSLYAASPAAVIPPTASIATPNCSYMSCSFDGSGSTPAAGTTITGYSWDFGDGSSPSTGATATHVFGLPGTYTVTLTVTGSNGASSRATTSVTAQMPPAPPTAAQATPSCTYLVCSFDASGSSAMPGATITGYSWDFGDGSAAGSGATPSHRYTAAGTYTATVTVTDSNGLTDTSSKTVTLTAPPNPTAAQATPSCTNLTCSFDASGSTAPTGATITGYSWDFGDGSAAGSGATPSHTYTVAGTYTATVTVTDTNGNTDTASKSVTVTAPPGPPSAAFTSNCTALSCTFDGTSSVDASGTPISSYSWSFMSGQTGTGATPSFTFPAAGVYPVTLTVSDVNGTDSVTHKVTVTAPANPTINLLASDGFNRTVTGGWGTAPTGGAWSPTGGTSNLSVANGVGVLNMPSPGIGPGVYLGSVSSSDTSTTATFTTSAAPSGNGVYLDVVGRRISSNTDYRGRVILGSNGSVSLALLRMNAGVQGTVKATTVVSGLTFAPGTQLNVQLQVTGTSPTTMQMKIWAVGSAYPANWQITGTDTTSGMQVAGSVGLISYLPGNATISPVAVQVSTFASSPTVGLPTAAATVNCTGDTCSADGTGSTDPSGTISSYTWVWGDGSVTTGATSSHTYATGGTYTVTLTVKNPSGNTDTKTTQVTVP
ncbi:MAG TPA: PKD domain-containing protein, partial [Microbacterium sp.]|uniref:PKD domain-containing protein n=1 Tax=Microbacterium sp. TaxID=51671 RepID=UPI002B46C279